MNRTLLHGIKVVEMSGLAPVPYCGMVLADFGAHVTLIKKRSETEETSLAERMAKRKSVHALDLNSPNDLQMLVKLCQASDVLLDPYRPGVLEKMGLDPIKLLKENKGLVVCRLTGYGQTGPLSREAGHDINYVSITGVMSILCGHQSRRPWPPANLLADFAGGGLTAAFGIVAALLKREKNGGYGCIIDCSMSDGLSYLSTFIRTSYDMEHLWTAPYAAFSGDCPIYRTYKTKDDKWVAVGALEPKFNTSLFRVLGMDTTMNDVYTDPAGIAIKMEEIFRTKTRDEWIKSFSGQNACVTPVLELGEAVHFEHNLERNSFIEENKLFYPAPAPKMYSLEEYTKLNSKL